MRTLSFLLLCVLLAVTAYPQGKKKTRKEEEPPTQVLPLPKELPAAVSADSERLVFHVVPLTDKGLLSKQVRDGLRSLFGLTHGATIVKLRAFVAGSGDLRRVITLVSETFDDRKVPLPALTVIQVGPLPLEGAQVSFESIAVEKKAVNPNGLAFFSGQQAQSPRKSVEQLAVAARDAGVPPKDILRTTCFLSSLDQLNDVRTAVAGAFPSAATNYVQLQRIPTDPPLCECEAVGRLGSPSSERVRLMNPDDLPKSPNYSQIALAGPGKLVLSGAQLGFGDQTADVHLAFERLRKDMQTAGAGLHDVFWTGVYPLARATADQVRAARFEFFDKSRPPASTFLLFEGLPSLDATFAIDVIAVPAK